MEINRITSSRIHVKRQIKQIIWQGNHAISNVFLVCAALSNQLPSLVLIFWTWYVVYKIKNEFFCLYLFLDLTFTWGTISYACILHVYSFIRWMMHVYIYMYQYVVRLKCYVLNFWLINLKLITTIFLFFKVAWWGWRFWSTIVFPILRFTMSHYSVRHF